MYDNTGNYNKMHEQATIQNDNGKTINLLLRINGILKKKNLSNTYIEVKQKCFCRYMVMIEATKFNLNQNNCVKWCHHSLGQCHKISEAC